MPELVDVEAWHVYPQRYGTRQVVVIRYCVWDVDGCWHATDYAITVEPHHVLHLIDGLTEAVGLPSRQQQAESAERLARWDAYDRAAIRLRRRGLPSSPDDVTAEMNRIEGRRHGR